jgi:putative ABC transport system substrate-binding protein
MQRRKFIMALGGAAAWPVAGRAQQSAKTRRIAIIHPSALAAEMIEDGNHPGFTPFFAELRRLGYVEGQNLIVERYVALGDLDKHQELAQRIVRSEPDIIFSVGAPILLRLKEATATIPVVGIVGDPVALGITASLARPGGNITGSSVDAGIEIWTKRLELLREAAPQIARVAFLTEKSRLPKYADELRQTAERLGVQFLGAPLSSPLNESEYKRVFAELGRQRADALIVSDATENFANRAVILELVGAMRLPTMYPLRDYIPLGGLLSYGSNAAEFWRSAAVQIDQIFRGAKPGDIPFNQPTKFTLAVNLRTAKALGLTIPVSLLVGADEVIE